ncbi:hypothetical protein JVX98_13325 [Ensifer sp. PDNC004]|uniref:hypothetical protein n=1 Tax=Ensifer sp. PDNC004 TaxID=2811423 RepID=UPI0019661831|nr:hypothetical protein [Ensifer sp. PDNC004]QRY69196.1 hypothetical protein JVX98_13325 [Ensifer sp. PDNC004]
MAYKEPQHEYASGRAATSYALDPPAKQHFNAVEHARNVMEAASGLSNRVNALVSRLMGPSGPSFEDVCDSGRPTYGPGIFPSLHDASDETGLAIRKANEALDRLEKELA